MLSPNVRTTVNGSGEQGWAVRRGLGAGGSWMVGEPKPGTSMDRVLAAGGGLTCIEQWLDTIHVCRQDKKSASHWIERKFTLKCGCLVPRRPPGLTATP